jgi:transaldolase
VSTLDRLAISLFADGADPAQMLALHDKPYIKGFTTNPTLMRASGITNYRAFAKEILATIRDKPISFEVFADDFAGMQRQALEIAGWAHNVYVKVPVTDTRGNSTAPIIRSLATSQVKLNVTAVMTLAQVHEIAAVLERGTPSCVSIFAGRIADTGVDPSPLMAAAVQSLSHNGTAQVVWASAREILNIFQADKVGCHVITLTADILKRLPLIGHDLAEYSLETVKMFYADACSAGFDL